LGLSRNKVAVGEPAAGSPPFYGKTRLRRRGQPVVVVRTLLRRPGPSFPFPPAPAPRTRKDLSHLGRGFHSRNPRRITSASDPTPERARGSDWTWVRDSHESRAERRGGSTRNASVVKLERVRGGCFGAERRRRTWSTAISPGEVRTTCDPGISECGNAARVDSARSADEFMVGGSQRGELKHLSTPRKRKSHRCPQ
jgi:hypothetical protein